MIDDLRAKRRAPGRIPFRAAADGFVTELGVRDGALVQQGDRLLQTASVDPVWVSLAVAQSAGADVALGADVLITTRAFPGRKFVGRVDLVSPRLDERTRTVTARVVVANADGALKPNMVVAARIGGAAGEPVVHVPSEAVIRGAAGDRVVVALGEGRFATRSVVLGRESGDRVAIADGLREGDQVVTSGMFLIDAETNLESGLGRLDDAQAPAAAPSPDTHHH
jgi:Cu(I)/Ag(I) efflux system membrane fusion protein